MSKRTSSAQRSDRTTSGTRQIANGKALEVLSSDGAWNNVQILFYGPPGIGKTWLCGTASQVKALSPVILIDNDGGSKTVRGKEQFKGIAIVRVFKFEAYNQIYDMIEKSDGKYRTVIIDNLGALHTLAMELEMEKVCEKDSSREFGVPSQREYGIVRAQIHKLLRFFSSLNINLLITAHAELDKDDLSNITRIRPALPGKLAYEVAGFVDIVGYLASERDRNAEKKGGGGPNTKRDQVFNRVVYFQNYNKIEAKDESDTLGISIPNPTMLQISESVGLKFKQKEN